MGLCCKRLWVERILLAGGNADFLMILGPGFKGHGNQSFTQIGCKPMVKIESVGSDRLRKRIRRDAFEVEMGRRKGSGGWLSGSGKGKGSGRRRVADA